MRFFLNTTRSANMGTIQVTVAYRRLQQYKHLKRLFDPYKTLARRSPYSLLEHNTA